MKKPISKKIKLAIALCGLSASTVFAIDYILHVPANGTPWVERFPSVAGAPTPAPTPAPGVTPTPAPAPAPAPAPIPAGLPTNTVAAASCSFSAVQAAVTSAPTNTRVTIPAGDCSWGTSSLIIPGGIYLKGAGVAATTIRRTSSVAATASLFRFQCSVGSAPIAVSDMQLVGLGTVGTDDMGIRVEKNCTQNFRIFNNKLSKFTFAAIDITEEGGTAVPNGVIYNNEIINNYTVGRGNLGYGVVIYGNNIPSTPSFGTASALFVEQNTFIGNRHSIASSSSARYVFRHNTLTQTDVTKNWGQVDAHGTTSASQLTTTSWEIYNNTFLSTITSGSGWNTYVRGGDGVFYNNTFAASIVQGFGWENENGCTGTYPIADQTRSVHIWGNTTNAVVFPSSSGCGTYMQLNRDYFLFAKPSYLAYPYPHPLR